MKPDMSEAHAENGNPDIKNTLGDSDQSTTPSEHRADAIADPEKGQESPPEEKEEQVRAITGVKVGDVNQRSDPDHLNLGAKLIVGRHGI